MLLKLAVVKNGIFEYFEREKLSAYFSTDEYDYRFLIVNDLTQEGNPKKIGVFQTWDYWRYIDE